MTSCQVWAKLHKYGFWATLKYRMGLIQLEDVPLLNSTIQDVTTDTFLQDIASDRTDIIRDIRSESVAEEGTRVWPCEEDRTGVEYSSEVQVDKAKEL